VSLAGAEIKAAFLFIFDTTRCADLSIRGMAHWQALIFFVIIAVHSASCQNATALEERGSYSLSELGGQNFLFTSSAMLDESQMIQVFLGGTTTKVLINMRSVERGPSGISFTQTAHWEGSSVIISEVLAAPHIIATERMAFALFVGKSIGFVTRQTVIFYVPLVSLPSAAPTLRNDSLSLTSSIPVSDTTFAYTTFASNKDAFSVVYQSFGNDTMCLYHDLKFYDNMTDVRDTVELLCEISPSPVNLMPLIWEDRQLSSPQFYLYHIEPKGAHVLNLCSHIDKPDNTITCQPESFSFPSDMTVNKTAGIAVGINLYYIAYLTDIDLQIAVIKYALSAPIEYTKPIPVVKSNKVQFKLLANDDDGTVTILAYNTDVNKVQRIVVGAVIPLGSSRPELGIKEFYEVTVQEFLELNLAFSEIVPSVFSMTVAKDVGAATTLFYSYPYCGDSLISDGEFCDSTENCKPDCTCYEGFETSAGTCVASKLQPAAAPANPTGANINTIAPAVVVPVCAVGLGAGLLVFFLRRRDKKKKEKKEDLAKNNEVEMTQANPTYNSIPTPAQSSTTSGGSSNNTTSSGNQDDRMNIPYSELKFLKEVGVGGFGKVFLGEWQKTQVALKISSLASSEEFMREAELLINLRPHPNVVQVLGVSTDGINVVMIMEYCEEGSLDRIVMKDNCPLTPKQKIELISGIAKGIYHLHRNNIVHRDLASRNVLMSRGQPKISDFGMSRKLQESSGLGKTNTSVGPIRWMAPESLKDTVYSTKTDVWSFGIVCWEIFSGREPHADADALSIGKAIRDEGLVPKCEESWDPFIVQLMQKCWNTDASSRPDFEDICSELQTYLETSH
jgi:c-src tyrosine kinase